MLPWKAEGFQISHFYWLLFKWHHSSEKVKTGNGVVIRCYRTAQSHQMVGMEDGLGGNSPRTQKAPMIYGSGKPHSVAVSFPLGEVWWVGRLFKCEAAHSHTSNRHVHMYTHTHITHTHTQGGKRHLKIHHAFIQETEMATNYMMRWAFIQPLYAAWKSKSRSFCFSVWFKLVICCYMESVLCTPVNIYS